MKKIFGILFMISIGSFLSAIGSKKRLKGIKEPVGTTDFLLAQRVESEEEKAKRVRAELFAKHYLGKLRLLKRISICTPKIWETIIDKRSQVPDDLMDLREMITCDQRAESLSVGATISRLDLVAKWFDDKVPSVVVANVLRYCLKDCGIINDLFSRSMGLVNREDVSIAMSDENDGLVINVFHDNALFARFTETLMKGNLEEILEVNTSMKKILLSQAILLIALDEIMSLRALVSHGICRVFSDDGETPLAADKIFLDLSKHPYLKIVYCGLPETIKSACKHLVVGCDAELGDTEVSDTESSR